MTLSTSGWGIQPWGAGGSSGGGDSPEVINVSPTPGTLLKPQDYVRFDVIDTGAAIRRTFIWVTYLDVAVWEVVFDGTNFSPAFSTFSTRVSIANGFHYNLRRGAGWLDSQITLNVVPINVDGNEG